MKKIESSKNNALPDSLDFNDEFNLVFAVMENTEDCIFITGKAGTGKSTLLKYFRENTSKNVVVLAPTGVSAINVGGQTIHSFFKFPSRLIQKENIRRRRDSDIVRMIDAVIIDEVSMVRADLMDGIDHALRINRNEMDLPFGGVQMIFFGDLFQLSPVVEKEVMHILSQQYESPYFFDAEVFRNMKFKYFELERIYRQKETGFIDLLNKIRNNEQIDEDLELLNKRVKRTAEDNNGHCVVLTPTNVHANTINEIKLSKLQTGEYKYEAAVTGDFNEKLYPTEYFLKLKKGAQVILLKNDPDKRWVNGTIAEIAGLTADCIKVLINENVFEVPKTTWEKIEYEYSKEKNKIEGRVIGTFEQYPIKLAWAITIHKSQGQTFDNVIIDLGHGAFTHGQVYVALSRCTKLEGIILKRPVIHTDIIFDERINRFKEKFCFLS
ncbi:MAG: AAA family ATPase [bacterium]|nr:AAA family ATPase [bacterium]